MNHFLKALFLVVIISLSIGAKAQLNYRKGYVITNSNDTLYGRINNNIGNRNSRVCLFKETKGSRVIKFYPDEIKAYRFINDKYYATKEVFIKGESRKVFVDVLLEGKINLYHYRKTENMTYYIEKKDSDMTGLLYKEITITPKTPKSEILKNNLIYYHEYDVHYEPYKHILLSVFRDCEKITNKIVEVDYSQKSLIKITKEYLKEVCTGNDCINYERDLNMYRPTVGLFSGIRLNEISFLASNTQSNQFTSLPVGIFFNFPIPLLNDRLSFQFELISNSINYTQEFVDAQNFTYSKKITSNTIGLPLLFKYKIAEGRVSPFVSVGKEIAFVYHSKINESKDTRLLPTQKGGWLGEIGVNYKLTPKLSLISTIRFQSNRNLIVGNEEHASYNSILRKSKNPDELKTKYSTFSLGLQF